ELLRPLDGQPLRDVHELAAAVVALARVALRVFVGQHGPQGLEHRLRDEVLRGDQLQLRPLAPGLVADGVGDLGIDAGQVLHRAASVSRCYFIEQEFPRGTDRATVWARVFRTPLRRGAQEDYMSAAEQLAVLAEDTALSGRMSGQD